MYIVYDILYNMYNIYVIYMSVCEYIQSLFPAWICNGSMFLLCTVSIYGGSK